MMYKHKKRPSYAWIEHPLNQEALSCSLRSTSCGSETNMWWMISIATIICEVRHFLVMKITNVDALVYVLSDWSPFNSLK